MGTKIKDIISGWRLLDDYAQEHLDIKDLLGASVTGPELSTAYVAEHVLQRCNPGCRVMIILGGECTDSRGESLGSSVR